MTREKLNALAHRLAFEQARLVIESDCVPRTSHGSEFFDTNDVRGDVAEIRRCVAYLDARKLLVRDPKQAHVVRIKGRR